MECVSSIIGTTVLLTCLAIAAIQVLFHNIVSEFWYVAENKSDVLDDPEHREGK